MTWILVLFMYGFDGGPQFRDIDGFVSVEACERAGQAWAKAIGGTGLGQKMGGYACITRGSK